MADVRRGAVLALAGVVLAFLILLYPGMRTPRASVRESAALLASIEPSDNTPLGKLISRLSTPYRQALSNALAVYAEGDDVPIRPPRGLVGPSTAPVRITSFSDILCGHCADLHRTVKLLMEKLPPGSFAYEMREFPLDAECNPAVQMTTGDGLRCLAARALICAGKDSLALADALFENQRRLTKEKIYELAEPFLSRERLDECVASPETAAELAGDIEWATEHDIVGTPLVLVNGREATPATFFLFAIVLAKGDPENPAFAVLPPPGLRQVAH
jgi:serine/threonine-protein kinase